MKKQFYKLTLVLLLAISVSAIMQMAVYAQNENSISILKSSDESYIIYVEEALNTDFLFAFSDSVETKKEDLTFSASGLDSNEFNVAYMSKELARNITDGKTYMWIEVNEELTVTEINLNQAVTEEEVTFVNSTTKRIEVDTTGSENTNQDVDGVKISHSQGKVKITEDGNAFSYYMIKVTTEENKNFVELAEKINNSEEMTNYERVTLVRQFTDTYNTMLNNIEQWSTVAENKEILQPQESEKGDIYLVWLRNDENNENDVQILICDDEETREVEPEKKITVYETVKLPITYDSIITLIIAVVILVAIIITLVIIKKNIKDKQN